MSLRNIPNPLQKPFNFSIYERAYSYITKTPLAHHGKVIKYMIKLQKRISKYDSNLTKGTPKPTFIVRVDDFPRWDIDTREFERFHEVMKNNDIPYILGVTPFLCEEPLQIYSKKYRRLNVYEVKLLARIKEEGVEIGLHGFTHQTIQNKFRSELIGLDPVILEEKIKESLEELKNYNIQPNCFIPPFNTFDYDNVKVLKKYFTILYGGPESVQSVGFRLSPSWLDGMTYIPSYYPAYAKAEEMYSFMLDCLKLQERIIVPLTLHWAWEKESNYRNVAKLCKIIKGYVLSCEQSLSLFKKFWI